MQSDSIDAVFCVDRKGLKHFAVSATSLAMNRPHAMRRGYLISADIAPADTQRFFEWLEDAYGIAFTLLPADHGTFTQFPAFGHIPTAAYFRLDIGSLLPPETRRVLYLDYDTIVRQTLEGALEEQFREIGSREALVGAVEEDPEIFRHLSQIGLIGDTYFNSGVMLIDLKKWRESQSLDSFLQIRRKYAREIHWHDQDILNLALVDRWVKLPRAFNGMPKWRDSDTLIVHYAGNQKPWRYRADVQDRDIYEKYRRMTKHLRPLRTDPVSVVEYYVVRIRQLFRILLRRIGLSRRKAKT